MNRKEYEAKKLIREIQHDVRPVVKVRVAIGRGRPSVHTVSQVYSDGRVRTDGGDVWVVKEVNDGDIKYEAVR